MVKVLLPLFLILLAGPVLAMPAVSCHCFQDRSFDPQRAAAADPYFLATAQNSLLAAAFGIPKKEVVRSKMSGSSGEDLWISLYLASRTGKSAQDWMGLQGAAGGWAKAIEGAKLPVAVLGTRVGRALEKNTEKPALPRAVVDEVLLSRAGTDPAVLSALEKRSASIQETILAVFLAAQTGQPALGFLEAVQGKNQTWGSLLDGHKIPPGEIESRIARMLR